MTYASKAGTQSERTVPSVRRHNTEAIKTAAFEKQRGIPSLQSVLGFIPVDKAPTIQRTVETEFIEISDSDTEDEIQFLPAPASPVHPPFAPDDFIGLPDSDGESEDNSFEIIGSWVTEREGEATSEQLVIVDEDDMEEEEGREDEEEREGNDDERVRSNGSFSEGGQCVVARLGRCPRSQAQIPVPLLLEISDCTSGISRGDDGQHQLLCVAEVHKLVCQWLHRRAVGSTTPRKFRQVVADDILPGWGSHLGKYNICERTARRWLKRCSFEPKPTKKGVYEDGHEREDVMEYREQVFLPRMEELERRAVGFEPTDEGGWSIIEPSLALAERRVVFYFHAESFFHRRTYRKSPGSIIASKRSPARDPVAVSMFRTSSTIRPVRRLVHTSTTEDTEDARVIIKPGSQGDAW